MALVFKESLGKIQNVMLSAFSLFINKKLRANSSKFVNRISARIPSWIREQPEVHSLLEEGVPGSLNAQFGLVQGQAERFVDKIIEIITQSVLISFTDLDRNFKGSVSFTYLPKTFAELIHLEEGSTVSEKGAVLDWSNWLLLAGDQTIVTSYHYLAKEGVGRSEGGIMVPKGVWRVPPQYSGTSTNNFITRAFEGRDAEIQELLKDLLV